MKALFLIFVGLTIVFSGLTQERINNSAEAISGSEDRKVQVGGYAQIDYNQPVDSEKRQNGILDVHRMVVLFGYRFNDRTNFVSEIELEHVNEVYVEQAFLNYRLNSWLNFRGGLMLVPMGIINEYHEPPTFNGVERPNLDSRLIPTTWREIGAGFTGRFSDINMKYQLYLMNGFNGYNGKGNFKGTDGFRSGRQKGLNSFLSSPNIAGKVEFYGVPGLNIGFSYYGGKSQSTLYNGLDPDNSKMVARADSSVVGISMIGLDGRYTIKGLLFRGQFNHSKISNSAPYNRLTGNDLGSSMVGGYVEAGYNLFRSTGSGQKLIPFVRYEKYDTHYKTEGSLGRNLTYNRTEITFGIGWWLADGAVLKIDYQLLGNAAADRAKQQFNAGIGIMF